MNVPNDYSGIADVSATTANGRIRSKTTPQVENGRQAGRI